MTKLTVLSCENYDFETVLNCVDKIIADFGGIETFLAKGKKIFIKPNLVSGLPPERCATTHPSLVRAFALRLVEAGAEVTVGDSCGGPYTHAHMTGVYKVSGIAEACRLSGAVLNENYEYRTVDLGGLVNRRQEIISAFLDADAVLNIAKLKTHGFTGYSCAVKNLYGLIPGLVKAEVHSKFPDLDTFCGNLIDIERFASPKIVLNVVDGVMGMEGEGPTNGTPRFVGKIIASDDAYIADVASVRLFDNPSAMPLLRKAVERGVLASDFGASIVDGYVNDEEYIKDFKRVEILDTAFNQRGFLQRFLKKEWITRKPKVKKSVCRGCEKCFRHCPRQAISMRTRAKSKSKLAKIDLKKCIRCYCCQELCPFNAVKLKKPLLYKIARLVGGRGQRKN